MTDGLGFVQQDFSVDKMEGKSFFTAFCRMLFCFFLCLFCFFLCRTCTSAANIIQ